MWTHQVENILNDQSGRAYLTGPISSGCKTAFYVLFAGIFPRETVLTVRALPPWHSPGEIPIPHHILVDDFRQLLLVVVVPYTPRWAHNRPLDCRTCSGPNSPPTPARTSIGHQDAGVVSGDGTAIPSCRERVQSGWLLACSGREKKSG